MAQMPELADVDTTLRAGAPEVQIVYNRDLLARYDLNIAGVAQLVRSAVAGFEATRFNLKDRRIPILVRFEETDRSTVDDVRDLVVNPGTVISVLDQLGGGAVGGGQPAADAGRPIRLSAVADVRLGEGPSEVRRIDGRRVARAVGEEQPVGFQFPHPGRRSRRGNHGHAAAQCNEDPENVLLHSEIVGHDMMPRFGVADGAFACARGL